MNFLNPLILFGLAAASIPVLIHLLNLKRQKKQDFSTLKFLKEIEKSKIRSLKLKQILLLILRTLLIICIVLAFARPVVETSLPGFASYESSNTIIIIDNSFSMEVSDSQGERFRNAKQRAKEILSNLSREDKVLILPSGQVMFSSNKDYLKEQISSVKVTSNYKKEELFAKAEEIFSENKSTNNKLIIISDGQNIAEQNIAEQTIAEQTIEINQKENIKYPSINRIVYARIGDSENPFKNLSVDSLVIKTDILSTSSQVEMIAYVQNHSESVVNSVVLSLGANGKQLARKQFDIDSGQSLGLTFSNIFAETGLNRCEISLENDGVESDNKFYFGLAIPPTPKILLIGQDDFLVSALENNISEIFLKICSAKEAGKYNYSEFDVVIVNGFHLPEVEQDRIVNFVETGGKILLFPSETKIISEYNLLSKFGFSDVRKFEAEKEDFSELTYWDEDHPLFFGVFEQNEKIELESIEISKAIFANGAETIIGSSEGDFLGEMKFGEGKLAYFSVSPDLSWSTFTLTGLFPSLLNRMAYYLPGQDLPWFKSLVGEKVILKYNDKSGSGNQINVSAPEGNDFFANGINVGGASVVNLIAPMDLGVYGLYDKGQSLLAYFMVNHASDESVNNYSGEREILDGLDADFENAESIKYIDSQARIEGEFFAFSNSSELWKLLVLLALFFAVAEMIVQKNFKNS
jgi:Aerotolerance regulator N-terminal/von Willebrand factor type A domain